MIFYFSGTGNSRYVAERIAAVTGDSVFSINEQLKTGSLQKYHSLEKLVIVTPTYAWRIPKVVADWIDRSCFAGTKVWFIMTCGSEIGNAAGYNRNLCKRNQLSYMGTAGIRMPENYIAMFNAPIWDEAEKIIAAAEPDILSVAEKIKKGDCLPAPRNNLYDRIMSGLVNEPFYRLCVKADRFWVRETCIGCKKCAVLCPLNNIALKDGKPLWGRHCTHCMACICSCPAEAIEYGKKSIGKPRYLCKK